MVFYTILLCIASLAAFTSCQSCPATPDAEVLILGAGMAGIAAAKTLSDGGVSDFIILEAQDKIGGRIASRRIADVDVEIGANWIQHIDNRTEETRNKHPIWALSQRCFPEGFQGQYTNYRDIAVYNNQQQNITDRAILTRANYTAAILKLPEIAKKRLNMQEPDVPVREGLNEAEWQPSNSIEEWVEWFYFDYCFGESPNKTSLYDSVDDIEDLNGATRFVDYFVTDQRGYASLVQCLADEFKPQDNNLRDNRLHLNANVSRIEWSDECVCALAQENGQTKRYCAPYAIMTFGIGVLKSKVIDFVPSLPKEKVEAIDGFDMIDYLKLFVEFDKVFWEHDSSHQYIGRVSNVRGDYPIFHPLDRVLPTNPKLLLVTLVEEIAVETVNQPDSVIKEKVTEALRSMYGEENVPEPVDMVVPDWTINPLFYGMYSNSLVGTDEATASKLASPLGRLYFSGEATSSNASGFVHGAYYTGVESANAVIKDMQSSKSGAQELVVSNFFLIFIPLLMISLPCIIGY